MCLKKKHQPQLGLEEGDNPHQMKHTSHSMQGINTKSGGAAVDGDYSIQLQSQWTQLYSKLLLGALSSLCVYMRYVFLKIHQNKFQREMSSGRSVIFRVLSIRNIL